MCNHVRGEAIAIGSLGDLRQRLNGPGWNFPGRIEFIQLVREEPDLETSPLFGVGIARLSGVPHGLEVHAVSKLSAALSEEIAAHKVSVDLNYILPLSADVPVAPLRLTPLAESWTNRARELATNLQKRADTNAGSPVRPSPPVALIDSGLNVTSLSSGRELRSFDYSNPGTSPTNAEPDCDVLGHGTRVASLLDACLPQSVPLVSAKLSNRGRDVTVLNVVRVFADVVSRFRPLVVNLSLAPAKDDAICDRCGEPTLAPAFYSTLLHHAIRLAAPSTFVVMAAGNSGRRCTQEIMMDATQNLVFAVAINSRDQRASYSSTTQVPGTSLGAFGGDGPDGDEKLFVADPSYGTSFAAPFVTACAYGALLEPSAADANAPTNSNAPNRPPENQRVPGLRRETVLASVAATMPMVRLALAPAVRAL
jgi:hypothetical protein